MKEFIVRNICWKTNKFKANIQFLLWRVNAECLNL